MEGGKKKKMQQKEGAVLDLIFWPQEKKNLFFNPFIFRLIQPERCVGLNVVTH